jgi:hypothetical protein
MGGRPEWVLYLISAFSRTARPWPSTQAPAFPLNSGHRTAECGLGNPFDSRSWPGHGPRPGRRGGLINVKLQIVVGVGGEPALTVNIVAVLVGAVRLPKLVEVADQVGRGRSRHNSREHF